MTRDVTVVIVSYETADLLRRCLDVLFELYPTLRVVVVDNASRDDSVAVCDEYPSMTVIALDRNIGFAAAVNRAAQEVRTAFLMLLNPDTALRPGAIEALVEAVESAEGPCMAGGVTLRPTGVIDPRCAWQLPTTWSHLCFALGLSTVFKRNRIFNPTALPRWDRRSSRRVGYVSGSMLLMPSEIWRELNGMDPSFFVYGEDVDFAMRARAMGIEAMTCAEAQLMHEHSASTDRSTKLQLLFAGKVTLARQHARPSWTRLLVLGILLRSFASPEYRRLWRLRHLWRSGFPSPQAAAVGVVSRRDGVTSPRLEELISYSDWKA